MVSNLERPQTPGVFAAFLLKILLNCYDHSSVEHQLAAAVNGLRWPILIWYEATTHNVLGKRWRRGTLYLSALNRGEMHIASTRGLTAGSRHRSNLRQGASHKTNGLTQSGAILFLSSDTSCSNWFLWSVSASSGTGHLPDYSSSFCWKPDQ